MASITIIVIYGVPMDTKQVQHETINQDLKEMCPATTAVYEHFSRLELETRNPAVPRFFRLPITEMKARNGGFLAVSSTPFTVVIMQGHRVEAHVVLTADRKAVSLQAFSTRHPHACLSPMDTPKILAIAEQKAHDLRQFYGEDVQGTIRAEVWGTETLQAYKDDLKEAVKADFPNLRTQNTSSDSTD